MTVSRSDLGTFPVFDPTNPTGVSTIYTEELEYTHPAVATQYANDLTALTTVFNTPAGTALTQSEADQVAAAFAALMNLAQNGSLQNNTPTTQKTYYLTSDMASNLDLLLRSFKAVGVNDPTQAITLDQLNTWKDLSIVSPTIQNTLQAAIASTQGNRSTQALIELDYVATGNQLINDQMTNLESALNLTQTVLSTLTTVQNLRNEVVIKNRGALPLNLNTNINPTGSGHLSTTAPSGWAGNYNAFAACTWFTSPIMPTVPSAIMRMTNVKVGNSISSIYFNPASLTAMGLSLYNKLIATRSSLLNLIPVISGQLTPAQRSDQNSIYGTVKTIVHDLSLLFVAKVGTSVVQAGDNRMTIQNKASALFRWLMDGNDKFYAASGLNAGVDQQNVTTAISSAENLNSTNQENVRNFIFVFEEYYKSASSILQNISQIIQKMAQHISQ